MWLGSDPGKGELTLIKSRWGWQLRLLQVKLYLSWRRKWSGFQKHNICVQWVGVWGGFHFFWLFFNGKKIKPQGAKKMLMDEMLWTYGMENCAPLSQKAASEERNVAAASQVPDPSAPPHHCSMCLALVLSSSRPWGKMRFIEAETSRTARNCYLCQRRFPPSLLLSTHRSIKELNSSHVNFRPASLFWHPAWENSCFSADVEADTL